MTTLDEILSRPVGFMVICEEDNVCVFSENVTLEALRERLKSRNFSFQDIFPVRQDDLQYYLYEPLHLSESQERSILNCL